MLLNSKHKTKQTYMKTLQFNVPTMRGQSLTIQEDILETFYPHFHRHQEAQLMWIKKGKGVLIVECCFIISMFLKWRGLDLNEGKPCDAWCFVACDRMRAC